jgi:hypothetical protein
MCSGGRARCGMLDTKKARGAGPRDRPRGGKEAARTFVSVLRQMITWGVQEKKLKRQDNPAANMEKNLPKKKRGERVLSLEERREARRRSIGLSLWSSLSVGHPDWESS